jgi:hypothetical protein
MTLPNFYDDPVVAQSNLQALMQDKKFVQFLSMAERDSGLDPAKIQPLSSQYRLIYGYGTPAVGELQASSLLDINNQQISVEKLIKPFFQHSRAYLVAILWAAPSFPALKSFLRDLKTITRYAYDIDGHVHGCIMLADFNIRMIELIENGQVALPNGDQVSSAITRMLGLRAKVMMLRGNQDRYKEQTRWEFTLHH